jgi:hypothetical protein
VWPLFDVAEPLYGGGAGCIAEELPAADTLESEDTILSEAVGGVLNQLLVGKRIFVGAGERLKLWSAAGAVDDLRMGALGSE